MNERIFLSPPHMSGREFLYLYEAFHNNWIAPLGGNVDGFENELSAITSSKAAVALSSGTAAVFMGLKALGVKEGDSVLCSDLTFAGSCFPIRYLNSTPVLIDSDPISCNMSARALKNALENAAAENRIPRAAVIVDLYGNSADYDKLLPLCDKYNVPVLEDSAEALGASYHGRSCGTFGKMGVFSFNGNKIVTTSGGGAVVSDNAEYIDKIRFWSSQSKEPAPYYEHREIGYNFRLSNICAGIGRGQLSVLREKILGRRRVHDFYVENLKGYPLRFIPGYQNARSNHWLSVMILSPGFSPKVSEIIAALKAQNIESRHMWKPMHDQPVFRNCRFYSDGGNGRAVSSDLFERGVCLPSGETLSTEQLKLIVSTVKSCF